MVDVHSIDTSEPAKRGKKDVKPTAAVIRLIFRRNAFFEVFCKHLPASLYVLCTRFYFQLPVLRVRYYFPHEFNEIIVGAMLILLIVKLRLSSWKGRSGKTGTQVKSCFALINQ